MSQMLRIFYLQLDSVGLDICLSIWYQFIISSEGIQARDFQTLQLQKLKLFKLYFALAERRSLVVSIPTSQAGGCEFKPQ